MEQVKKVGWILPVGRVMMHEVLTLEFPFLFPRGNRIELSVSFA